MRLASKNWSLRLVVLCALALTFGGSFGFADDDDPSKTGVWPNKGTGTTKTPGNWACCSQLAGMCCNWHPAGQYGSLGSAKWNTKRKYIAADFAGAGCGAGGQSAYIEQERPWGDCGQATKNQPCVEYGKTTTNVASCVYVRIYSGAGGSGNILCRKLRYCGPLCVEFPTIPDECLVPPDIVYEEVYVD